MRFLKMWALLIAGVGGILAVTAVFLWMWLEALKRFGEIGFGVFLFLAATAFLAALFMDSERL